MTTEETTGSRHRWPLWPWLVLTVAGVVVTAVAAIVGTLARSEPENTAPATPTRVTVTQFETATVTKTVTASPATGPLSEFRDGLFEVGVDVQPGTYRTDGPDGSNAGGCYWSRTDATGNVIDNGVVNQPGTVSIAKGERVDTAGCLTWRRTA
ncbi:hypothetical protein [Actinophytocola sp.]|jgi:hypothetical protein|uniref:hypothetical protein n=1 Tax=Actinophytocola sp. TaxID=1872138 RepID=UPI002EDB4D69